MYEDTGSEEGLWLSIVGRWGLSPHKIFDIDVCPNAILRIFPCLCECLKLKEMV